MIVFVWGIFFLFFELTAWGLMLTFVIALVLRLVNPSLFNFWLYKLVSIIEYPENDDVKRSNDAPKRRAGGHQSSIEVERLKERLKRTSIELEELKTNYYSLRSELEKSRNSNKQNNSNNQNDANHSIHSQISVNSDFEMESYKQIIDGKRKTKDVELSAEVVHYSFRYAYAPTSSRPYGFKEDDWSIEDNGQPFFMQITNDREAKFSLSRSTEAKNKILNSLAYYSRLIDYDSEGQGLQPATNYKVKDVGLLSKDGEVWTIQKKIKIIIY